MNSNVLTATEILPAPVAEFPPAVDAWEIVRKHIQALLRLEEDWDGEGAPKVPPALVRSAMHLVESLKLQNWPVAHDVYPLPDGNIMLEWQHPDGIIKRIEVEGSGRGELMVTYPLTATGPRKPAEFTKMTWEIEV